VVRRLSQWSARKLALVVTAVVVAGAVVALMTGLVGGESDAYKTGRSVGVALFKSGTPIEKCANVRQGAGLTGLDGVDEHQDFYEGCLAGYEDAADDR
jgi:hypothetical protein